MRIANGNYIVIEGNIGAGKTSLSHLLANELDARLILEEFSDNPFLPLFYQNPERFAFPVELFFMTERHKQMQLQLLSGDLFRQYTVSDYIFSKTLLFAGQNLGGEELRLFQNLFDTLNASFPSPDLLVYLHRDTEVLQTQIRKRNRPYELSITSEYLLKIQNAYFSFFKSVPDLPILVLDLNDRDFLTDQAIYDLIKDLVSQKWLPGLHTVRVA